MGVQATGSPVTRVNTATIRHQTDAQVTALDDGGWVVAWVSSATDKIASGIVQQRYSASGSAVGSQQRVTTSMTRNDTEPTITGLADGGWLLTWRAQDKTLKDLGLYQRRYDATGAAIGPEARVTGSAQQPQTDASVTALGDGGWVVTWQTQTSHGQNQVVQQRYDDQGQRVGQQTQVGSPGSEPSTPSVTALPDGGWVVSWQRRFPNDFASTLLQQRYDADGKPQGPETSISDYAPQSVPSFYDPVLSAAPLASLADGGWVVASTITDSLQRTQVTVLTHFDASGMIVQSGASDVRDIQGSAVEPTATPAVTALSDGGWVLTWSTRTADGYEARIFQTRFDARGVLVGPRVEVASLADGNQLQPSVTALADGGWVVTWTGYGGSTDGVGIYQRHFAADVYGTARADSLSGTGWDEYLVGYGGDDLIDGGAGADIMLGGFGNDTYVVDDAGDVVRELAKQGTDTVRASVSFSLRRTSATENLTLTGDDAIDGTGNGLANVLTGNAAANRLNGGAGNDRLIGGQGDDTLIGGDGVDVFVFTDTGDRDVISDFDVKAKERIDLSGLDADATATGDQAFVFIGGSAFHGAAGELRARSSGGSTTLYGDTNGDCVADFSIRLAGVATIGNTSILL
ncbi:hypothetical protein V5F53_03790 [Xanthobacter sp. V4C-4]|uniref:calcium-binding protein n=1 Tax=Xanthobacter cornucopiae TaxID=3119924 RepID=UPI003727FD08